MAALRWAILALVAALAVFSTVKYGGFAGSGEVQDVLYTCPMHPQIVSKHPGECPICGMTLVPVEKQRISDGHAHAAGGEAPPDRDLPPGTAPIHVDPSRVQLIGVKTVEARREVLLDEIETYAVVGVPEELVVKVHARTSGWVTGTKVKRTGQKVGKGQVLFRLYSPEAFQAQQEYVLLLTSAAQLGPLPSLEAQKDAARVKMQILGVPPGLIAGLEKTLSPLKTVPVTAPAGGVVMLKNLFDGSFVTPETELLEIADLSKVWVTPSVPQDASALVKPGDEVSFTLEAYPGEAFNGRVDQLLPSIDPDLRTREVRVVFPNADGRLVPGMYGKALIGVGKVEGIILPEDAVIFGGETSYVFVDKGEGHFEPRVVQTGLKAGGRVQILSGVSEGESVVASGNFLLDSESKLKAAASSFGGVGNHAH